MKLLAVSIATIFILFAASVPTEARPSWRHAVAKIVHPPLAVLHSVFYSGEVVLRCASKYFED